jgi:YggT family protein
MTFVAAVTRDDVAGYVDALIQVYTILIFAYIVTSLIFSMGARIPYNRWSNAILSFLRDVCEPYLRIFRRFIPMAGPLDLSPIVAIFVLQIVGRIVVNAISG